MYKMKEKPKPSPANGSFENLMINFLFLGSIINLIIQDIIRYSVNNIKQNIRSRCVMALALIIQLLPGFANTIPVTNTDDLGAGSLRNALTIAASGDTIIFDASLSGDTIRLTSGHIAISENISILGLGMSDLVIDAAKNSSVFSIDSGYTVIISDFTIINGFSADSGGAIYNSGKLTLANCRIAHSSATHGGGIYNGSGITINGCIISNNTASGWGGGIYSKTGSLSGSNCTITNNASSAGGGGIASYGFCAFNILTISDNQSSQGGGIYADTNLVLISATISNNIAGSGDGGGIYNRGNSKLNDCMLHGNQTTNSSFSGGALFNDYIISLTTSTVSNNMSTGNGGGLANTGTLALQGSTVDSNTSALAGGGIENNGTLMVNNSTISGNNSSNSGGGINTSGKTTISRSTIAHNMAGSNGGGIFNSDSLLFSNTIIANNTAGGGPEIFNSSGDVISLGYNLIKNIAQSGISPGTGDLSGTAANPIDPLISTLQDNEGLTHTHLPICGSPAIDAGSPAGAPATDQRGKPRIHGPGIDIGSVESQEDPLDITGLAVITPESTSGSADGSIQLSPTGGTGPYYYRWNNGDSSSTRNQLIAGNYSVTVEDFFGCEASAIFTVELANANGIKGNYSHDDFRIYPNPAIDKVLVSFNNCLLPASITIINANGKVSKNISFNVLADCALSIDISALSPGFYTMLMDKSNQISAGYFIKVH